MNIFEQLKRDEGSKLTLYKDTKGIWTIGTGHNLEAKGISRAVEALMLQEDVAEAAAELDKWLPWTRNLSVARRGVLLNMAFNMGARLLDFKKFLGCVQAGEYREAALEMMNSKWARQVGDGEGGNFDRAERLAKQMVTDEWQ